MVHLSMLVDHALSRVTIRATAVVLAGLLFTSEVHAQDRTTEAGEAAILGTHVNLSFLSLFRSTSLGHGQEHPACRPRSKL
jgi:hypothetical protein